MKARGKAKRLNELQAKKEAKKAAKAAGGGYALLPKLDADGNPYTKEAVRRMIRRIRKGKPAIPEGKAKRMARKRGRQEGAAAGNESVEATAKPKDGATNTSTTDRSSKPDGKVPKWRNKGEKYKANKELRAAKAEAKKKLGTGGTPFLRMMLAQEQHLPKAKTKKDKQSTGTKKLDKKASKADRKEIE